MAQAFMVDGKWFKKCAYPECGHTKPVDEFLKNARCPDGYSRYCRRCNRFYYKEWREKNKEKCQAKSRAYYVKNKEAILKRDRDSYMRRKVRGQFKVCKYDYKTNRRKQKRYARTAHGLAWILARVRGKPELRDWLLSQDKYHKLYETYAKYGYGLKNRPSLICRDGQYKIVTNETMRRFHANRKRGE